MFKRGRRLEQDPVRHDAEVDLSDDDARIVAAVKPYTMTTPARVAALLRAVEYVERRGLPGAYAECGVWMGGSVLAILMKLLDLGVRDRHVYAFDTFEGMPMPSRSDVSRFAPPALEEWEAAQEQRRRPWGGVFDPSTFNLEAVSDVLRSSGYPPDLVHLEEGRVEETLPERAPAQLALLRLDTDWYESTRHELAHLYPRLVTGGVLVIDDYGHWEGCRRAVDEYFDTPDVDAVLLNPVDYTCWIGVKV